jgi:outer membrane lipoprotein-sorting protein
MKIFKTLFILLLLVSIIPASAQTADEIIANYIENTGGSDAWSNIKSMKATGVASQGGMNYPFVQTVVNDGRMVILVDLQGQQFIPQAFDGENMWATNFQSMQAEASDAETSLNYKNNEAKEFPDPFINYAENGYTAELIGEETVEGTECYKITLTKNPLVVDGTEETNIVTYYFDKEDNVPVMSETTLTSGPGKGSKVQSIYSEYLEAGDVFIAHEISQKFNGQVGQTIKINEMEINGEVDESLFVMPVAAETPVEDKN